MADFEIMKNYGPQPRKLREGPGITITKPTSRVLKIGVDGFSADGGYFFSRRRDNANGLGGVLGDLDASDFPILDLSSDAGDSLSFHDPSGWLVDLPQAQHDYLAQGGWTFDDTGTPTMFELPPGVYSTYFYATFNAQLADQELMNLYLWPGDYNQTYGDDGADAFDSLFFNQKWGTGTGDYKVFQASDHNLNFVETFQRIFVSGGILPWVAVVYPSIGSNYRINDLALQIVKER